ncbi:MAG TPA: hypothetical protein VFV97_14995 [Rhodanobacteraceae bacterium]|nr:hypothetical protein [Rhodanobacteraceae bacterium]
MRRTRACALLLLFACLGGGCWNNPPPPTHEAAAFAWRADIVTDAPSPLYRFELTPELDRIRRNGAPGIAVLDATGAKLFCGGATLRGSNDPVFTLRNEIAARVREGGDLTHCDDAIPTCIAGKKCGVPDECPRKTIDTAGTALDDATRPEDILDALHVDPSPPACRPESSDAARECTSADAPAIARYHRERQRREDARHLVERYGIKYTGHYPQPLQTVSTVRNRGGAIASGPSRSGSGAMGGAIVGQFNPGNGGPVDKSPPKIVEPPLGADIDAATWLVTLADDVPKNDLVMLELTWNLPPPIAYPKAALVTFDARGELKREKFGIGPDADKYVRGAPVVQSVPTHASTRYLRVVTPEATPDLHLVGARAFYFTPKPFAAETHDAVYWFEPSDHPPFHVGLDARNGDCSGAIYGEKAKSLPRLAEADWPPAARLGAPERGASNTAEAIAHDQTLSAWIRWARYVLVAWLAALAVTAARWAWLARVASPRRSDRSRGTTR